VILFPEGEISKPIDIMSEMQFEALVKDVNGQRDAMAEKPKEPKANGVLILEHLLQDLYDSEINVEIMWCWDGGFEFHLNDIHNEVVAVNVKKADEIAPALAQKCLELYPESAFAKKYATTWW
jgi:hypothetical protein